jgi:lysophospholipase L1-like esterase
MQDRMMRKWIFLSIVLGIVLGLPALGAWAGHRWTQSKMRKKPWRVPDLVAKQVKDWQRTETLAGTFAVHDLPLEGVENFYYSRALDFNRITWIGPDMPTPFVGYAPAPGPLISGHINSLQFRYARELDLPKPRDVIRVFLVGGSVAYSAGATANDTTIGGYLEKYLNERWRSSGRRFEVITAAASGWASTHERILVENRLVELEPDLVVAVSGHNDAHWGCMQRNVLWFRSYQDEYYFRLANSLLSCNFNREFPGSDPGVQPVSLEQSVQRLARNVRLTQAALATVGADYCFALQPILACSHKGRTEREKKMMKRVAEGSFQNHYSAYRQALADLRLPGYRFVDLTALFDAIDQHTDIFIDGCHFGDRGHDAIALALRDALEAQIASRLGSTGSE